MVTMRFRLLIATRFQNATESKIVSEVSCAEDVALRGVVFFVLFISWTKQVSAPEMRAECPSWESMKL